MTMYIVESRHHQLIAAVIDSLSLELFRAFLAYIIYKCTLCALIHIDLYFLISVYELYIF